MKLFLIKSIIFLTILWGIDMCFGIIIGEIAKKSKGGDTYPERYIADKATEEIIIMGSSRASHHYIPSLFKEAFNLNCYNAGTDGNGIILMYGKYKMLTERHKPNIIVYDIFDFDIKDDDKTKYLGRLKIYYGNKYIKNIFNDVDWTEKTKMELSRLYWYNSTITSIILNSTISKKNSIDGYLPLNKTIDYDPEPFTIEHYKPDSLKLHYIEKLIKECDGKHKLIFTISPYYFKNDISKYNPIIELCKKYNIPILDHSNDSCFIEKKDLFQDKLHLNHKGAEIYTRIIIQEILDLLSTNHTD